MRYLAYGWLGPALAYAISVLGLAVGILLAGRARPEKGHRYLSCAALSVGALGVWQLNAIAVLGLRIDQSAVRVDPATVALSLCATVLLVGIGAILSRPRPGGRHRRFVTGGLFLAAGIAAAPYTLISSVHVSGSLYYVPDRLGPSLAIVVAATAGTLWLGAAPRRFRTAAAGALVIAGLITALHHAILFALRVEIWPSSAADELPGVEPTLLVAPIVIASAALAAVLAYFALGGPTVGRARALDDSTDKPARLDPRLVREVILRVSLGSHAPTAVSTALSTMDIRPLPRSLPQRTETK